MLLLSSKKGDKEGGREEEGHTGKPTRARAKYSRDLQVIIQDEELLASVFHGVAAEVVDERRHGCRLALASCDWDGQGMATLIRE